MSSRAASDEKALNSSDGSGRIGTSSDRKTMLSRQPSRRSEDDFGRSRFDHRDRVADRAHGIRQIGIDDDR